MRRLFDSMFEEVEVDLPSSRQTSQDDRQSLASNRDSGARGSNDPYTKEKE